MAGVKRLIVGLGNPGAEYEATRHNVGFRVVDAIAEAHGISLRREPSNALTGWGSIRGRAFGLCKPLTYMNRSGSAVLNVLRRTGIKPGDMLVVVDDINLEPGVVRVRPQGSAGGHNGLQDIIDSLGTDAFPRLRIGIGSDFRRGKQADYVLSPFSQSELPVIEEALLKARDAAVEFVTEGIVQVMNRYNRR